MRHQNSGKQGRVKNYRKVKLLLQIQFIHLIEIKTYYKFNSFHLFKHVLTYLKVILSTYKKLKIT